MKKSLVYFICGVILLLGAIFCCVKVFQGLYAPRAVRTESYGPSADAVSPVRAEGLSVVRLSAAAAPEEEEEPYESPVDFEALWEINPDIYGWLEIGNTEISYPIVQDPEDDEYYLDHNSDREYSANGAIFSEATYNSGDLTDPVTLLYGHHMKSGAMFGDLQKTYSDDEFFEEDNVITIYTPEEALEYHVFAAVPFTSEHLLYEHDFTDEKEFEDFFDSIHNIRDLSSHLNEEYFPEAGDRVIILSTCLAGNNTRRFLVMASLPADQVEMSEIF